MDSTKTNSRFIKVIYFLSFCALGLALIAIILYCIMIVIYSLADIEHFTFQDGFSDFVISFKHNDTITTHIIIPRTMIALGNYSNYKLIGILYYVMKQLPSSLLVLLGIYNIKQLIKPPITGKTPFTMCSVKNIRIIGLCVLIYYLFIDMFCNIIFSALITKVHFYSYSNIHIEGLFLGLIIFVIAEIFKQGIYLQEEFDTTL